MAGSRVSKARSVHSPNMEKLGERLGALAERVAKVEGHIDAVSIHARDRDPVSRDH